VATKKKKEILHNDIEQKDFGVKPELTSSLLGEWEAGLGFELGTSPPC
jgi:hypothetical protein